MVVWEPAERGVSPVVGVALLVAIVVALSVLAMTAFTGVSESALDSSAVHGTGSYEFSLYGDNAPVLRVTPESVDTRDSEYRIRINGEDVYDQWDGKSQLEIECLSPWDEVTVYTAKGSTTNLVNTYDVDKFLKCPDKIGDGRFEHTYFNGDVVNTKTRYDLPLAIDPDGPGDDSTPYASLDENPVGPVPFANQWHYSKLYNDDGTIEGFQKPVWVFILVDNVHWSNAPSGHGSLTWSDDVPSSMPEPGAGNYQIDGGTVDTSPVGSGEPTNDIYIVFKPKCDVGPGDESKLKIVDVSGTYENQILLDGTVVVPDTTAVSAPTIFDAPGIPC